MNEDIFQREAAAVLPIYKRLPVVFERGEGCYLYDSAGKRYLDLVAGVAVNTLGHCHPEWVQAVAKQAATLIHTSNLYYTTPMVRLAEKLILISGMARAFFCNSGTEANEAAIKVARKWGKLTRGAECYKIVSFENGFHGRTLGALSATASRKYCEPFTPLVPGFVQIPVGDSALLDRTLTKDVCAVIIETIQGEAGVRAVNPNFIKELRKLCDERDILMIIDEVQTGIGRTGKWFGYQQCDVLPDLAPLAKGLGGGYPIGALLVGNKASEVLVPGDHGSTFAGSPLATTAAETVLRVIEEQGLLDNVNVSGELLAAGLSDLHKKFPELIAETRGVGLMRALDFKQPIAREFVIAALMQGLVLNATSDTTLRLVPPLIIGSVEIAEALDLLDRCCRATSPSSVRHS